MCGIQCDPAPSTAETSAPASLNFLASATPSSRRASKLAVQTKTLAPRRIERSCSRRFAAFTKSSPVKQRRRNAKNGCSMGCRMEALGSAALMTFGVLPLPWFTRKNLEVWVTCWLNLRSKNLSFPSPSLNSQPQDLKGWT